MALYTVEAVRANIRNREGKRVFYLGADDRLTPGARDFLRDNHIDILPGEQAGHPYKTLRGAVFETKPEDMTHLNGDVLVEKTHPRIAFRGQMDTLQAVLLLTQKEAAREGFRGIARELGQCLEYSRRVLSSDVLEEPLPEISLGGLNDAQLRQRSHNPQKYYGQPHFMPESGDTHTLLLVNLCRTAARQAELQACHAFRDTEGRCARPDLVRGLNRMSSFLWILEIRLKSGKEETHG